MLDNKDKILFSYPQGESEPYGHVPINRIYEAMDNYAHQESLNFFNWVIDKYTTDEGRLPLSGNTELGGRTIFINHQELPINILYLLYLQSKK